MECNVDMLTGWNQFLHMVGFVTLGIVVLFAVGSAFGFCAIKFQRMERD